MSTALQTTERQTVLGTMAARLNVEPQRLLQTLKDTVFVGASDSEMVALCVVANEHGLNPFTREIYAFKNQKSGQIVPIVSVDGWIRIVNRHPNFNGISFEWELEEGTGKPISCQCSLFVKGRAMPVTVVEYYDECFRDTDPWRKMPKRMLRHKAFIQSARLAFGLGGIFDEDEGNDVAGAIDVQTAPKKITFKPTFAAREETSQSSPEEVPATPPAREIPQDTLASFMTSEGFTFDDLVKWAGQSGMAENADSWTGFSDVPAELAKRWLRARAGLRNQLAAMKGAQ